jgi:hypothetical protein
MRDLSIELDDRPGALAEMGEALGRGIAHFLFEDGSAARRALELAGIRVLQEREVVVQRLQQGVPGQLGKLARRMAEAGVNIEVLHSDHEHQLILVVDDPAAGRAVAERWARERV